MEVPSRGRPGRVAARAFGVPVSARRRAGAESRVHGVPCVVMPSTPIMPRCRLVVKVERVVVRVCASGVAHWLAHRSASQNR